MWYENDENDAARKKPAEEDQECGEPAANQGTATSAHRPFAAQSDPTKAFEEDIEPTAGGAASPDELASLKVTIKELSDKANANYDRYLRALAELENYKKRVARERLDQMRYAGEDLLHEVLPVMDNLERTLAHSREAGDLAKVLEGVNLIQKQFRKAIEKSGVTVIDKAPCPFDPAIHQALEKVTDPSHPDDTVLEILQKGYILNGKVIRPAMVKVAKHR